MRQREAPERDERERDDAARVVDAGLGHELGAVSSSIGATVVTTRASSSTATPPAPTTSTGP